MNAPDDWNEYYTNCAACGTRYHASEGGCDCSADDEPTGSRVPVVQRYRAYYARAHARLERQKQ